MSLACTNPATAIRFTNPNTQLDLFTFNDHRIFEVLNLARSEVVEPARLRGGAAAEVRASEHE